LDSPEAFTRRTSAWQVKLRDMGYYTPKVAVLESFMTNNGGNIIENTDFSMKYGGHTPDICNLLLTYFSFLLYNSTIV
jgi:hypothetical protein